MRDQIEMYDAHGRRIHDTVLREDGRVRVPMMLTDSATVNVADIMRKALADTAPQALHKPGSLAITDADREAREKILDARDQRLTSAWKHPAAAEVKKDAAAPLADVDAAAARRDQRVRDAWKGAA
jgi:hypothetical protein